MVQANADQQEAVSLQEEKPPPPKEERESSPEEEIHNIQGRNHHEILEPNLLHLRSGLLRNQLHNPGRRVHPCDLTPTQTIPTTAHLTPSQLLYLAKGEPRIKTMAMREDSAHIDGEPFLPYKAFTYATSHLDDKRFSKEAKRVLQIPRTYTDAINSPEHKEWKITTDKEKNSLKDDDVYDLVPVLVPIPSVPHDNKIIGSRFVFEQNTDGRFKAPLVVQAYVQEPGIDSGKSYTPVCRIGSVRMVLAMAREHGWSVWQLDVQVAYLQSKIEGRGVYVTTAPGQEVKHSKTGEPMVYKLKRSLHGLAVTGYFARHH